MSKLIFALYMHVYYNKCLGSYFQYCFLMVTISDFARYFCWRMLLGWGLGLAFVLFLIDGPFLSWVNGNKSCESFFLKSTNLSSWAFRILRKVVGEMEVRCLYKKIALDV